MYPHNTPATVTDMSQNHVHNFSKRNDGDPDIPEPTDLDGDVAYIPDDLSGYMEYDTDTIKEPKDDFISVKDPDDDVIIELDGEVPADYYERNY